MRHDHHERFRIEMGKVIWTNIEVYFYAGIEHQFSSRCYVLMRQATMLYNVLQEFLQKCFSNELSLLKLLAALRFPLKHVCGYLNATDDLFIAYSIRGYTNTSPM